MKKIFIEKGTPGNIIITFVFTKLETEHPKLLTLSRAMQKQCLFQMGWSYKFSQTS
jgi:hypothetical protein